MGRTTRRRRVEPTDEWEQLALLCRWPAQRAHEEIPPLMLFGSSVAERASETGTPERTLYRRVGRFEEEGVEGLFGSEHARPAQDTTARHEAAHRGPGKALGRAEYPAFNPNEIANAATCASAGAPTARRCAGFSRKSPSPAVRAPLCALSGDPRGSGAQACGGRAARRGLKREGHLRLPADAQVHRPPRPASVGRGRARGARRPAGLGRRASRTGPESAAGSLPSPIERRPPTFSPTPAA